MKETVRFRSVVEPWKPGATGGLMIAEIPDREVLLLGGLKQMRVTGTINGAAFTSNTMPRGGRRLALGVSRAMMTAARVSPGDAIEVEMARAEP